MLKLLTLQSPSSFSADAQYRIQSRMEHYGLYEDNVAVFADAQSLLDEALISLEDGFDVILAADNDAFIDVKHLVSGRLLIEEEQNADITEVVAMLLSGGFSEPIDLNAHATMPKGSIPLISNDGLYSGFGYATGIKNTRIFLVPLDYSRTDSVLDALIAEFFGKPDESSRADTKEIPEEIEETDFDFLPETEKLIYSLVQQNRRIAFSQGEATQLLLPLVPQVKGFGEVAYFIDENRSIEPDDDVQVMLVRRAHDCVSRTFADYGVAVSDVIATDYDNRSVYAVYVAVVDKAGAKVKKITTENTADIPLLLPHAVSLVLETMNRKLAEVAASNISAERGDDFDNEDKPVAPLKSSMFLVTLLVALVAIGSAVFLAASYIGGAPTTTAPSLSTPVDVPPIYTTTQPSTSETQLPTGTTDPLLTTDPNYSKPAEPTASQVAQSSTAPSVSSESGTFTFYVFGYGHGTGLSQEGAEHWAKQGWNYAEILTNYYYGTTLVLGEPCPETVIYAGSEYKMRDYLATALETEMGAGFSKEALKAQAVALYTYAKYYNFNVSSTGHGYGKAPSQAAYAAVDAVYGQYLTYNGSTALTPFHAISAGKTTSYYNVWGTTSIPYLAGGRPSYGDYDAKDFSTSYTISSDELKSLVKSRCNVDLTGDPSQWLQIISHDATIDDDTGYVYSIRVGSEIYTGYKFRCDVMAGTLRSHCFKFVYTPNA